MAGTSGRPSSPPPVPPPPAPPPPAEGQAPTAADLERAIASVAGVVTAQVSRSPEGRDRLRISLAPGADSESAAWAVAATLRERFGIALDPAAITARIAPKPADAGEGGEGGEGGATSASEPPGTEGAVGPPRAVPVPRTPRRYRAAIHDLLAHVVGDDLDVTATLLIDDREGRGTARGLRTRRGRWRAICEATLSALSDLTAGQVRATVDHVTVLSFPDLAHVTVSVTLLTDQGEETFLGAALVRDDADRAVMRATLDALNRRVEPWLVHSA